MQTVVALFFICIFFVFIELVPLYQEQQWMSFWVYTILLIVVFFLAILIDMKVEIPSPADPIKKLISAIWGLK